MARVSNQHLLFAIFPIRKAHVLVVTRLTSNQQQPCDGPAMHQGRDAPILVDPSFSPSLPNMS
jgi:hypothetical protein